MDDLDWPRDEYDAYCGPTLTLLQRGADVEATEEVLDVLDDAPVDLILSDMNRAANPRAGLELLKQLRQREAAPPLVFYVGQGDPMRPTPIGAFGITDRPDRLLHCVFDVLERRRTK